MRNSTFEYTTNIKIILSINDRSKRYELVSPTKRTRWHIRKTFFSHVFTNDYHCLWTTICLTYTSLQVYASLTYDCVNKNTCHTYYHNIIYFCRTIFRTYVHVTCVNMSISHFVQWSPNCGGRYVVTQELKRSMLVFSAF